MKIATCLKAHCSSNHEVQRTYEIWVEDFRNIGDAFISEIGAVKIIGFPGEVPTTATHPSEETEWVKAENLRPHDTIYYKGEWRTVVSAYLHETSCYQKAHVSQSNSSITLYVKLARSANILRKTEKAIMSVALLTSHDLVKSLQAKLADYQALAHAPERVEVVPTVFVDKEPIMSALKANIKAEYSKLGEQLKKL